MKKLLLFTILTAVLFGVASCNKDYDDPTTLLIISPYVFSQDVTDPNESYNGGVYNFEPLELNEVRLLAPSSGAGYYNFNIYFEYEGGIIEAIGDDVQITLGANAEPFYDIDNDGTYRSYGERMYGYNFKISESGYMSFCPIGGCYGYVRLDEKTMAGQENLTITGHEFYVTINAYKDTSVKWPTATAVLKFVQLEDKDLFYGLTTKSRFFSIELVSYK